MHLTHYGHACVLVDTGSARLLFDPGAFSAGFEALEGLDGIDVRAAGPGDRLALGGADVAVVGSGDHAEIHRDIPVVANNGYLVDLGPAATTLLVPERGTAVGV